MSRRKDKQQERDSGPCRHRSTRVDVFETGGVTQPIIVRNTICNDCGQTIKTEAK